MPTLRLFLQNASGSVSFDVEINYQNQLPVSIARAVVERVTPLDDTTWAWGSPDIIPEASDGNSTGSVAELFEFIDRWAAK